MIWPSCDKVRGAVKKWTRWKTKRKCATFRAPFVFSRLQCVALGLVLIGPLNTCCTWVDSVNIDDQLRSIEGHTCHIADVMRLPLRRQQSFRLLCLGVASGFISRPYSATRSMPKWTNDNSMLIRSCYSTECWRRSDDPYRFCRIGLFHRIRQVEQM